MSDLNQIKLYDNTTTTLMELGEKYGRHLAYSPRNDENYTPEKVVKWLDDYAGVKDELIHDQLKVIAMAAQAIPKSS